jgi:SAM-dependent methyltransferase
VTDRVLTPQARERAGEKWRERLALFRLFLRERQNPAPFYERLANQVIASLPRSLDGARVLDLGCGPGHYTEAMRRAGAVVVPIDADFAELQASGAPVDGAVVADARHLPLRDATLDGVVCSNILEHTGSPATMVGEIERVLRDGGWLWLSWTNWYSPWGGHELSPWHYLGQRRAVRIYERRTGHSPKNAPGRSLFPVHVGRTLELLRSHPGFRLVDAVPRYYPRQRWILRIPGLREVATWNCLVYLERRERGGPMLTTTASTASTDRSWTGHPKAP